MTVLNKVLLLLGSIAVVALAEGIRTDRPARTCPTISRQPCTVNATKECLSDRDCSRKGQGHSICCNSRCGKECSRPRRACPPCPYGFARNTRNKCRCFDPCQKRCGRGEKCHVIQCVRPPCPALCLPIRECPDVSCPLRLCPFGFAEDQFGCTTCDCRHPCKGACPASQRCNVLRCTATFCPVECVG